MNPCSVERIENADDSTLFGPGSVLILRAHDTGREYAVSYEQIAVACDDIADIDEVEKVEMPDGKTAEVTPIKEQPGEGDGPGDGDDDLQNEGGDNEES